MPKLDDRKKEYDVLSLDTTAKEVEVKKAFTRLALKYHPDLHSPNKPISLDSHSSNKSKYQEVCKAYKKIMADDSCSISDWNNDKSDEIFFSLLGELLQNSTRNHELYTLLSPQVNSRPQFQNDNEYRCKEDVMEDDDEDSELNKLVDILKNRLQNGKSVPAGLTQEKLTRLKDDFMKQKEENKRMEQNHSTPTKKAKPSVTVPVAKPKPKNKKQLQAEQRRREREMANIAKELEEKKKKDEEKEQVRKQQEKERKRALEEETRKNEEDKKKQLNESRKRKEREEKEKEQRSQKEKEKNERLKKSQEEEQRRKEEEKRRKAEEKAAKLKAMKENKEREDREKQQPLKTKQPRSQQYQQYQQQQQKYPREVPPRFLRQQQMKQQAPRTKEQDLSYTSDYNDTNLYKEDTRWTAILPDTAPLTEHSVSEDWDLDIDNSSKQTSVHYNESSWGGTETSWGGTEASWGGVPASQDWDSDVNKQTRSSVDHNSQSTTTVITKHEQLPTSFEQSHAVNSLFGHSDPPLPSNSNSSNFHKVTDIAWGASLTGSTWDSSNSVSKQCAATTSSDFSKTSHDAVQRQSTNNSSLENTQLSYPKNLLTPAQNIPKQNGGTSGGGGGAPVAGSWNRTTKVNHMDSVKTGSPGITSWAGLDSFDAGSPAADLPHAIPPAPQPNCNYAGGAKPKAAASYHSYHSDASEKVRQASSRSAGKFDDLTQERTEKRVNVPSIDNKIDSNLKVTGWLQNTSEDWDDEEKEITDSDGWTTVSQKAKKATNIPFTPGTPSKTDATNAWTNRALKQLLDMGFKRDRAEKALRDNNGIIESAVSDLLMKGDCTESNTSQPLEEKPSSTSNGSDPTTSSTVLLTSASNCTTPQKLNRKQRRKLQQMQLAEQASKATANSTTSSVSSNKTSDSTAKPIAAATTSLPVKSKGDGLLPTPPASHRLIPSDKTSSSTIDKVISRPSKTDNNAISNPVQRSLISQLSQTQPTSNLEVTQNSVPHPPVGTRPMPPTPIQPPAPIQPPSSSQSSQSAPAVKDKPEKMNGATLQPPVNPVLLAQIQLQKLGLEDASVPSVSYNAPVVTTVSSQAVTNTIIQRYLQQIAQAPPEVESTPSVSASMHLSELIQQASVPANSLSDGPMKSKLLQWTQTSSASNSEPTTPPDDVSKSIPQKIDPVSAKWGVVAAPRLSPTPAEFKPGVPWRSRDDPEEEKSDSYEYANEGVQSHKFAPSEPSAVAPAAVQKPIPFKAPQSHVNESSDFPSSVQTEQEPPLHISPEQPVVRPPPGLMSTESKPRVDDANWLILKGINPAVDPSSIRSMCIQYGTILHFRAVANNVYVRYETVQQAENAWMGLNGRVIFNSPLVAEVSTEESCMKIMAVATSASNDVITTLPLTNHVTQPQIPPGYQNVSSFGTLWPTPQPPTVPPPLFQQSFNTYGVQPTTLGINGGFNHWTIPPMAQSVLPNTSQLWSGTAPQQPSNLYQTYPGWLTTKPEVPMQPNVFSPGMDRCLPSELFNMKEYSS